MLVHSLDLLPFGLDAGSLRAAVPKERGINADTRELDIPARESNELVAGVEDSP
jgi:hypothetical protein